MDARLADVDVMCLPTTPIVAPTMAEVATPDDFARKNAMALRNTVIVNFFNLCAISLPLPREGGLPTGLMLVVRNGHDRRLFRIAAAVEKLLQRADVRTPAALPATPYAARRRASLLAPPRAARPAPSPAPAASARRG